MVIKVEAWKLAYMAVPKAGCTSVKTMLATIDPTVDLPPTDSRDELMVHSIYPTTRFRPHRWETVEGYYRFTVIRDPIRRLLSTYSNRVVTLGQLTHSPKIRSGEAGLPSDPDPDFFFQNLLPYMAASSAIKHHCLPIWLFTGTDLSRYERVFRTDQLSELSAELSARSGQELQVERANSSTKPLRFEDLSPAGRDAVWKRLKPEYDFLADYVPMPDL